MACPDELWGEGPTPQAFWYLAYHTLFWLDFYMAGTPEGFAPRRLHTGRDGPGRRLSRPDLHESRATGVLEHSRRKCRATIAAMTDEQSAKPSGFQRLGLSHAELLLYNLRHVQHHVGQLQLLLRQRSDSVPRWVGRTNVPLED